MLARRILTLNRNDIAEIPLKNLTTSTETKSLIKNNAFANIDNAVQEIDRVIVLLEMLPYDDFEFIEALKILKGKTK